MKHILCYGDSNTWGYIPGTKERYPDHVRWTGVVQQKLGSGYRIFEDGLNGRTTVFDDPYSPCRNGQKSLDYSLLENAPLDLVVLSLGSNDLKFTDASGSKRGAERLINQILSADAHLQPGASIFPNGVKILLVSPIRVHADIKTFNPESSLADAAVPSESFAKYFSALADQYGNVSFLDAAQYAEPSAVDGIHMSEQSHHSLGCAIAQAIQEIL